MSMKKIVPVVAASAVIAGMTSVTAYAADAEAAEPQALLNTAPEAPAAEEHQPAEGTSTEIQSVTFTEPRREDADEPDDAAPPATEENRTETAALSGTGETGTPSPTEDADADPLAAGGETGTGIDSVQNGVINLDENGGSGSVEITHSPTESTEVTEPSGDPTEETTQNPDGSTTTTTTTPTETTTTTTDTTEIDGNVQDTEPVDPEDEADKDKADEVDQNIQDAIDDATDDKGAIDTDKLEEGIQNQYSDAVVSTADNGDGTKTHTVTFTTANDESRPDPLTESELGALLGVTVNRNEDGGWYYTREDGTVVNLSVEDNSTTESSSISWTVTVRETLETENGSAEMGGSVTTPDTPAPEAPDPETPGEEQPSAPASNESAADVLDKIVVEDTEVSSDENGNRTYHGSYGDKEAIVTKDKDGNIVQIISDNKTYDFTYQVSESEKIDLSALSDAQLQALLPEGYTVQDRVITNANGYRLTPAEATALLSQKTHIGMTVTDSTQGVYEDFTGDKQAAEQEAEKNAVVNAVMKAIEADGIHRDQATIESVAQKQKDPLGRNIWEVVLTEGGKTFTYTVTAENPGDIGVEDWDPDTLSVKKEELENDSIDSGKDIVVSGSAYVTGETVVWTEHKSGEEFTLDENGRVNLRPNDSLEGATVQKVIDNADGTTTVVTKNGEVTKTYTFHYKQKLDESDIKNLLAAGQTGDFTKLCKTTWEVKTEIDTSETKAIYVSSDEGTVVKNNNGVYEYIVTADGKTILLTHENGVYSDKHGATYEITEDTFALTDEQIIQMLRKEYQLSENIVIGLDNRENIATFTLNGNKYAINYGDAKGISYVITKSEKENHLHSSAQDLADEIKHILEEQQKEPNPNGDDVEFYIKDCEVFLDTDGELALTDNQKQYKGDALLEWLEANSIIDFDTFTPDQIRDYLESLNPGQDQQPGGEEKPGHDWGEGLYWDNGWHWSDGKHPVYNHNYGDWDHPDYNHGGYPGGGDHGGYPGGGYWQPGGSTGFDHVDLVTDPHPSENGKFGSEYVILNDKDHELTFEWSHSATDLVNGKGTPLNSLSNNISFDGLGSMHYEYEHNWGQTDAPDSAAYYHISGKVAYDFRAAFDNFESAKTELEELQKDFKNACIVKVSNGYWGTTYRVYKNVASLNTYGYMDKDSNLCSCNGYDLMLHNLGLLSPDKATAYKNAFAATLERRTESKGTHADLGAASETLTTTETTEGTGYNYNGSYGITEERDVTEKGSNGEEVYIHAGKGEGRYDSYTTWTPLGAQTALGATRTDYSGTLHYTYQRPGAPVVTTTGSKNLNRVIAASVTGTSVTTRPGTPIINQVTRPAQTTTDGTEITEDTERAPVIITPAETPAPAATTEITDPATPLAELPDAPLPLAAEPETVPDEVSDIADELVPLAGEVDDYTAILDAAAALADAPVTGDGFRGNALGGLMAAAGLGLLALRKKEDDED